MISLKQILSHLYISAVIFAQNFQLNASEISTAHNNSCMYIAILVLWCCNMWCCDTCWKHACRPTQRHSRRTWIYS